MTRTQRRVLIWLVFSLGLSTASYWYSRASLPAPRINVRWAEGIDERERQDLEKQFRLTDGRFTETRTWSYRLDDSSRANVGAIVNDRRVDDTYNIDRDSLRIVGAPTLLDGAGTALLVGFVSSTLVFLGVVNPRTRRALASLMSRDSPAWSAACLAAALLMATIVKAPSWRGIAWDDEELWMAVLKTASQARYWREGTWLALWDPLQGFGVPHPSATHLLFAPLFPLLLVFPAGVALSLHYSIMTAIGVGATFVLCRRLGASAFLAGVGALTWLSSCFVTQLWFADFWAQAFTFANLAPALVIVVLNFLEAARTGIRIRHVLLLGLVGGIVLNSTTPAGSVPFAVTLAAMAAVFLRVNGAAGLVWLLPAFALAVAMYAPSLVELWQEIGRFSAPRRYTMDSPYSEMVWTALSWPVSGSVRSAGLGAPFAAVALVSSVTAFGAGRLPIAWKACAAAAAACLVMYALPSAAFSLASGNGEWGQFLTVFAIPLAAAQVTAWYRSGDRRLQLLTWVIVLAQLALIGYWGARYWMVQRAQASDVSVGLVLDRRTELERALLQRIRPDRDRVLLSPSAEDLLLRSMRHGHASNFPRLGIPLINGMFKFVSYRNVYPDLDATWGTIQTHDEQLTPELLDVAGVSLLITPAGETPADPSMRRVGRYHGLGAVDFEVWDNLDVWPRVSFVDGAVQQRDNPEPGAVLWRRRALPARQPDAVRYTRTRPGRYSIAFAAARADRFLLITDAVRTDLLSVQGASVVSTGPLADVFTILKVPAGVEAIDVAWDTPLRRWLWLASYLTLLLGAAAYVVAISITPRAAPGSPARAPAS